MASQMAAVALIGFWLLGALTLPVSGTRADPAGPSWLWTCGQGG